MRTYTFAAMAGVALAVTSAQTAMAQTPADTAALQKLVQQQADLIKQLTKRVEALEAERNGGKPGAAPAQPGTPAGTPSDEPEIPPLEIPGENGTGTNPTPAAPAGPSSAPVAGSVKSSLLPDISVIGTNIGRFFTPRGDTERNRLQIGEFEIGLQQPVYPGIRFDAFLTAGADNDFKVEAEEAYATFSQIGHLPLGGYLGKKRLDFGKINPTHPHTRPYVDTPSPIEAFLGPDGLSGNGAAATYLIPTRNMFANLEVGLWNAQPSDVGYTNPAIADAPTYALGSGVSGNFPMARLWTSKAFGPANELEFGVSQGFGKADLGDKISLTGIDLTYRNFPAPFKRWMFQGEAFWHKRNDAFGGTGDHTRSGHYALLTYDPDQYTQLGLRYDNTKYPWPIPGRDQSLSAIWTNRLTEVTLLRFQYKHGDRTSDLLLPAQRNYNELWMEFLWGAGSHTHPLQ